MFPLLDAVEGEDWKFPRYMVGRQKKCRTGFALGHLSHAGFLQMVFWFPSMTAVCSLCGVYIMQGARVRDIMLLRQSVTYIFVTHTPVVLFPYTVI